MESNKNNYVIIEETVEIDVCDEFALNDYWSSDIDTITYEPHRIIFSSESLVECLQNLEKLGNSTIERIDKYNFKSVRYAAFCEKYTGERMTNFQKIACSSFDFYIEDDNNQTVGQFAEYAEALDVLIDLAYEERTNGHKGLYALYANGTLINYSDDYRVAEYVEMI